MVLVDLDFQIDSQGRNYCVHVCPHYTVGLIDCCWVVGIDNDGSEANIGKPQPCTQ